MHTSGFANSIRRFVSPISLASGTYYLSFLAEKSLTGSFKMETSNSSNQIRFGLEVASDGTFTAKSGTGTTSSSSGLFLSDTTFFVLAEFTNSGSSNAVTRVKLYAEGDQIAEDAAGIDWDVVTEPMLTGVDQDRLIITIEDGTVELDEILIGTSFETVTYDENYIPVQVSKELSTNGEGLMIQHLPSGVNVIVPQVGGDLIIYDTMGRLLYLETVSESYVFLDDAMLKSNAAIKIIQYQTLEKNYTSKVFR